MENLICLDKNCSTTRRLLKSSPQEPLPGVPFEPSRKDNCGGLRLLGYTKESPYDCPLISVVVLAFSDAERLEKTLRSVVDQSHDNIELIVICRDSSEKALQTIKNYNSRIDYWTTHSYNSVFDAMNKGIDLATGDWINFLNAGDTYFEESTIENLLRSEFNRADFLFGHTYFHGGDYVGIMKAREFNILWKKMIFTRQSFFAKLSILKQTPFDTRYKYCADYALIVDCYMKGLTFYNTNKIIAAFDMGIIEPNCAGHTYEKWKIIKQYRSDFEFHQYYLLVFIKRLFQDCKKKLGISKKSL